MSLQPCNESRKALFGFPAPLGVNEGQLTSTSGTSAAHLRHGYRGYRPEAPSACIIGGVCIEKKRGVGGIQSGGSSCPTSRSLHIWDG